MRYLFILGRNVELSMMEIFSYFEKEKTKVLDYGVKENGLLVEIDGKLSKNVIDKFGGVISIGEVKIESSEKESFENLIKEVDKLDLYSGKSNKFNYVVWDFSSENYDDFSEYLKNRFRSEKLKPTHKKIGGFMEMQEGEEFRVLSSTKNMEKQFFVFSSEKNNGKIYFGEMNQMTNYEEIEKRDMEKPVRREELSISPRLAKIMINLSQVKNSQTLLDPFCGIGVVLTEALLQGINVIGIDKDKEAIKGCDKNLGYFGFKENRYKLINWDSATAEIKEVNGIATEPDFGEIQKKMVDERKATAQVRRFEELMINVLNNLKKSVRDKKGKIVFTAPTIRTNRGRVSPNYDKIMEFTGLKFSSLKDFKEIKFPIQEFRKNQVVGREIVVLE